MYKARKRNRVLRIPDEKVEEYKKLGYTITDLDGNTVYEPQDDAAKIASLEREVQRLKQKITEYELIMAQKGVGNDAAEDEAPEQKTEKPKSRKTKTE